MNQPVLSAHTVERNVRLRTIARQAQPWLSAGLAAFALVVLAVSTVGLIHDVMRQGFTGAWASWVNEQQWFFQTGIVWGGIALVVRRPGVGWLSAGALIAFVVASTGLIDQTLHQWWVAHGFYQRIGRPDWANNPQFSKLIFYMAEIPVLLALCCWSRTRTLPRVFVLMQLGAIVLTTVAFHMVLPAGALNDYRQERVFDLRRALRLNDAHDFNIACQALGLRCMIDGNLNDSSIMPDVQQRLVGLRAYASSKASQGWTMRDPVVFNQGSLNSQNEFVAYVAGGVRHDDGSFWVAIDQDRVNLSWQNTEAYFSFLGWVAHGFWTLFVAFLIVFHAQRFRRRARSLQGVNVTATPSLPSNHLSPSCKAPS